MARRPSILDRLLGRNKSEDEPIHHEPEQTLKEPEFHGFMKMGGSPAPGITLKQIVSISANSISSSAWSPDGKYLAIPANTGEFGIQIWDLTKENFTIVPIEKKLENTIDIRDEFEHSLPSISWSPDGKYLAACYCFHVNRWRGGYSSTETSTIYIWDTKNWNVPPKANPDFRGEGREIAWSPDASLLTVRTWDGITIGSILTGEIIFSLSKPKAEREIISSDDDVVVMGIFRIEYRNISKVGWSPEGQRLAFSLDNDRLQIYLVKEKRLEKELGQREGFVTRFAWHPNGQMLAFSGDDKIIHIWDIQKDTWQHALEGHTEQIQHLSFTSDGQLLISVSSNELRLWSTNSWKSLSMNNLEVVMGTQAVFHPQLPTFASTGKNNTTRIWDIDYAAILEAASPQESVQYTTAKIVLVGDSGVGKTGLGWRLAHNEFKEHSSTHGQQFWVTPTLSTKREDGTECEAVLWDLAGQHVYRSMHSIFLEDVDAALVLFDPTNRQEPLKGADSWLEQLGGKKALPPSVLVGARVDRGAAVMSQQELEEYCQEHGITGGYVSTSAKSGEGLQTLVQTLQNQIPWDQMTATVTTLTFKRIKEFVLSLKERPERKGVLVKPDELRKQLQNTDAEWQFTDAEMMTAVNHLENHGYVTILKSSSGEEYILLVPELLVSAAASIFLIADKHPRELGAINETELLQGKYPIEEFNDLGKEEQEVLLDTIVKRFLEHHICFRDTSGNDNLLIFPSLIKQKRPLQEDLPFTDGISYIVRGKIENLYASLVVLLGYTSSFRRLNQWANQAQYETDQGSISGFRLRAEQEGELEFTLFYENTTSKEDQENFQSLFEELLHQRKVEITSIPPVVCPNGHPQERATVVKRQRVGFLHCEECGVRLDLVVSKPQHIGTRASPWLQVEEAKVRLRSLYETHLSSIKAYRRNWDSPRCYISHLPKHIAFVKRLKQDLNKAGVYLIAEAPLVQPDDRVVMLDSPGYQHAWETQSLGEDMALIQTRLDTRRNLISIVLKANTAAAHDLSSCPGLDFSDETHYFVSLFSLVLELYDIPVTLKKFESLRASLHEQWEQTLARSSRKAETGDTMATPLKIFISYSHKDEEFKDELVTMLAGLQRRGVIDAWQDRRIDAGDEWYKSIQEAMDECDLTLLLVSPDFIASRFIQEEELPRVLARREEAKLRVIPIIVRPCTWSSEPILSDLQALPKDAKPVIKFSKENGDRDQVWADIAKVIEKRAQR